MKIKTCWMSADHGKYDLSHCSTQLTSRATGDHKARAFNWFSLMQSKESHAHSGYKASASEVTVPNQTAILLLYNCS